MSQISDIQREGASRTFLVISCFAIVYLVWSSTYLAISVAVETIPPFLMTGVRALAGGIILYSIARVLRAPAPTRADWGRGLLIGPLFFCLGQGVLAWSEVRIPSGVASVIVGMVPLWVPLIAWAGKVEARPSGRMAAGLVIGFIGIVLLTIPVGDLFSLKGHSGGGGVDSIGVFALIGGTFAWALGVVLSKRKAVNANASMASAITLLTGGATSIAVSALFEPWDSGMQVSQESLFALIYLIVFGSVISFAAYTYLLSASQASKVATTSYVNPAVALVLGWYVLGEALSLQQILACLIILGGVVLVMLPKRSMAAKRV